MKRRLLPRHVLTPIASLALLLALALTVEPAAAQADRQALQPSDISAAGVAIPAPTGLEAIKLRSGGGLIEDPSFEATPEQFGDNPFWEEFSTALPNGSPFANNTTFGVELARTGDYFAIFGFADATGTGFVEQTVSVPEAGTYELTFYFAGGLDADDDGTVEAEGTLRALVDGEPMFELSAEAAPAYSFDYNEVSVPVTFDTSGDVPIRVELEIVANPGDDDVYQVIIDDVSLTPTGGGDPILDTGVVQTEVLPDGFIGANLGIGTGFNFDGDQGLFEGQFLVGLGPNTVIGDPYSDPDNEWVTVQEVTDITPPEGFDEAVETVFDAVSGEVRVTLRAFAAMDDPYVFLEYEVQNISGSTLDEVYVGPFTDWDVGAFAQNVGGYAEDVNLLYVTDESGGSTNYFGTVALQSNPTPVSGWNLSASTTTDDGLYTALTEEGTAGEPADDRRAVIGVGPYSIGTSETVMARFAVVAGADLDAITASAAEIQDAFPVSPILDTGVVETEVLPEGFFGANLGIGTGVVFDGDQGLFEGQFLVGLDINTVIGEPYTDPNNEWVNVAGPSPATPPAGYDEAYQAVFESADGNIVVTLLAYAAEGDPYVFLDYTVENASGSDLDDVYVGPFADWDVGTFAQNLGAFHEETNLLYVYDDSGTSTNYFGIAAAESNPVPVSGVFYDALPGDDLLYTALSNITPDPELPADRRTVLGTGPYAIASGESVSATFIVVAGESESAIIANAAAAQDIDVAAEETTQAGTFVLHAAYPNPFAGSTTIAFSLPVAEHVRLTVYDLLGRHVATLVDGVRQAGEQTVRFDATGLQSGTYFYRLEAGGAQLSERFTIVR